MIKYWVCIIEADMDKLPNGFDFPPRRAAIKEIEKHEIAVRNCWSGWGTTKKTIKMIKNIWFSRDSE